jgi:hypothetical protein
MNENNKINMLTLICNYCKITYIKKKGGFTMTREDQLEQMKQIDLVIDENVSRFKQFIVNRENQMLKAFIKKTMFRFVEPKVKLSDVENMFNALKLDLEYFFKNQFRHYILRELEKGLDDVYFSKNEETNSLNQDEREIDEKNMMAETFEFRFSRSDGEDTVLTHHYPEGTDLYDVFDFFKRFLLAMTYTPYTVEKFFTNEFNDNE